MKQWKKQLSAALCAALLLGCVSMPALAEENEEYDLSDIPGVIIEDPRIDPLEWNFALSLSDLDPELIKLANKECLLSSTYEPSSKTKMKLRLPPARNDVLAVGMRGSIGGAVCRRGGSRIQAVLEERLPRLQDAENHVQQSAGTQQRQG